MHTNGTVASNGYQVCFEDIDSIEENVRINGGPHQFVERDFHKGTANTASRSISQQAFLIFTRAKYGMADLDPRLISPVTNLPTKRCLNVTNMTITYSGKSKHDEQILFWLRHQYTHVGEFSIDKVTLDAQSFKLL